VFVVLLSVEDVETVFVVEIVTSLIRGCFHSIEFMIAILFHLAKESLSMT